MLLSFAQPSAGLPIPPDVLKALHLPVACLEGYSLGSLPESILDLAENHLLICEVCRRALQEIEPVGFVHFTRDGAIYSKVTRLSSGGWFGRRWGKDLCGGRQFGSLPAARQYLHRSFSGMFPAHKCEKRCGVTALPASRVGSFFL